MVSCVRRTTVRGFEALHDLRATLAESLRDRGVHTDVVDDLLVVVTELATNGIEASPEDVATVEADLEEGQVRIMVRNEGRPFERTEIPTLPHLRPRGRGLQLVEAMVDRLTVGRCDDQTVVTVERTC